MISNPLPKGTKVTLRRRDWGMERSHETTRGNEICTAAPYETNERSILSGRKWSQNC